MFRYETLEDRRLLAAYDELVVADNPTVYLRLNETNVVTGAIATDASGHGFDGKFYQKFVGALTPDSNGGINADLSNRSLSFNATSNNLSGGAVVVPAAAFNFPPAVPVGNVPATNRSLEVWFKTTLGGKGLILGQIGGGGDVYPEPVIVGSVPTLYVDVNGAVRAEMLWHDQIVQVASANGYNDAQWHHVVFTETNIVNPASSSAATQATLYVDGITNGNSGTSVVSTIAPMPAGYALSYSYYLGTGHASRFGLTTNAWNYFQGSLDEFAVYPVTLTPGQVLNHFLTGFGQDFSDAALSYGTAQHLAKGPMLGTLRDSEVVAPALSGSSDDATGMDDEDGLLSSAVLADDGILRYAVNQISPGKTAYVSAWMDFNGNGTFDSNELVVNDNVANNGTYLRPISLPQAIENGQYALRLRVSSTPITSPFDTPPDLHFRNLKLNIQNRTPTASRLSPLIDFGFGTEVNPGDGTVLNRSGSDGNVFGGIGVNTLPNDNYVGVWSGKLDVPADGEYQFTLRSDDGMVMYLDGGLLVNGNSLQSPTNRSGKVRLKAGLHDVLFAGTEASFGATFQASWERLGGVSPFTRTIIPSSALLNDIQSAGQFVPGGLRGDFYALATAPLHDDALLKPIPESFIQRDGEVEDYRVTIVQSRLIVTNTNDSGPGSLRQAIEVANQTNIAHQIVFDLPIGHHIIQLQSALPLIRGDISIQGPVGPTEVASGLASQLASVEIRGLANDPDAPVEMNGLEFSGSSLILSGLAFTNFAGSGIVLRSSRVNIENVFVGTNQLQEVGLGNRGHGILIEQPELTAQPTGIHIGVPFVLYAPSTSEVNERRPTTGPSNVISGNWGDGIHVMDAAYVFIGNNRIGTSLDGKQSLPNRANGIVVEGPRVHDVEIGDFNLISGNAQNGIFVANGTSNVVIVDNRIGVDSTAEQSLPNGQDGIRLESFETTVVRNVVSGNSANGITVIGAVEPPSGIVGWWTGDAPNDSLGREGLVAGYQTFDCDCDGTLFEYQESRGNVRSLGGASVQLSEGIAGRGLSFDSTTSGLIAEFPASLSLDSMSLDFWVKFDRNYHASAPGATEVLIEKASRNSASQLVGGWSLTRNSTGALSLQLPGGRIISTDDLIGDANSFYHISLIRDADVVSLYVNGSLERQASLFPHERNWYTASEATFGIDARNGQRLSGMLDEITLYSRPLSADEVLAIDDAGENGNPKPAMSNLILKNAIGTSLDGSLAIPNHVNGIEVLGDVRRLWIDRNTISGNDGVGVKLDPVVDPNFEFLIPDEPNIALRSNRIGTSSNGDTAVGNATGIQLNSGSIHLGIRHDDIELTPIISGNLGDGIDVSATALNLTIVGANVGLNSAGLKSIGNGGLGIIVERDDALEEDSSITITDSIVSANGRGGILLRDLRESDLDSVNFTIARNRIGLQSVGSSAAGNSDFGIKIEGVSPLTPNQGVSQLTNNTISGNQNAVGLWLSNTHAWDLSDNRIGTDSSGNIAVPNRIGLRLKNVSELVLPETLLVSGNSAIGVQVQYDLRVEAALLMEMLVGTNANGTRAIANEVGVEIDLVESHEVGPFLEEPLYQLTIGGVISGNRQSGLRINQTSSTSFVSISSTVGLNAQRNQPLPNGSDGITVLNTNSLVELQSHTLIAYNRGAGIRFDNGSDAINFQYEVLQHASPLQSIGRIYGNRGLAIDTQGFAAGANLESAEINDNVLRLTGTNGGNGKFVQFFSTHPTLNGTGQGQAPLGRFGIYSGPDENENETLSNNFDFEVPFPPLIDQDLRSDHFLFEIPITGELEARLLTAVNVSPSVDELNPEFLALSEFSRYVAIGTQLSSLAPIVDAGGDITLFTDESLSRTIKFGDDDSIQFSIDVDFGDGDGPQPLTWERADRSIFLDHVFRQAGLYTVTVSVLDDSTPIGQIARDSFRVNVLNRPPEIEFNQQQLTKRILEGQLVEINGFFTDSGIDDSHSVSISWGDESISAAIVEPTGEPGRWSYSANHLYQDDGSSLANSWAYRVVTNVVDEFGAEAKTPVFLVEVDNVLPRELKVATDRASIHEGDTVSLTGNFIDIGLLDTHDVFIDWGDGTPRERVRTVSQQSALRTFELTHRYLDDPVGGNSYEVTVEVADDDDPFSSIKSSPVFIEVQNLPPIVSGLLSSAPLDEGSPLVLFVGLTDPGYESHRIEVNWDTAGDPNGFVPFEVAAGTSNLSLEHSYAVDGLYLVSVRTSDGEETSDVRTLLVDILNFAPAAANLHISRAALTPGGLPQPITGPIVEGTNVVLSGTINDDSPNGESYTVTIDWGDGTSTPAEVNHSQRSFIASHRFDDDPTGASIRYRIVATALDGSEQSESALEIEVQNALPEVAVTPQTELIVGHPTFAAAAKDLSQRDQANLQFVWRLTKGNLAIPFDGQVAGQTQGGQTVSFDPSAVPVGNSPVILSLDVSDDDGGQTTIQSVIYLGTNGADRITVDNSNVTINDVLTTIPAGFTRLLILGLHGNDIIDGSAVTNTEISQGVFGGPGNDSVFDGSGNDIVLLAAGNDSLNDPQNAFGITPNMKGADHVYLVPNSVLAAYDDQGQNTLDFSLAHSDAISRSGITFDLSRAQGSVGPGSVAPAQDVVPVGAYANQHYVSALGVYGTLVGSVYGDTFTGASNATLFGGLGADLFTTISDTSNVRFHGGQDADVLQVRGLRLAAISFEGDQGADELQVESQARVDTQLQFNGGEDADVLINRGRISQVLFDGGADADVLQNLSGRITEIDFEGDAGKDTVINAADILWQSGDDPSLRDTAGLTFVGGNDADVLENRGRIARVVFDGGADADVLVNTRGRIAYIDFEGDQGQDRLVNEADAQVGWTSEYDPNLQSIQGVQFSGGNDADVLINRGGISHVIFDGGADADVLQNQRGRIVQIDFDGDQGADLLVNELEGVVEWTTADDAGLRTNQGIHFSGGGDADVLINRGRLAVVVFDGGADADVLRNLSGRITQIDFDGDSGADLLLNDLGASVEWATGDAVELSLNSGITFRGGEDADVLINRSRVSQVVFDGGADADVLLNSIGRITRIDFTGDAGADTFINEADALVQWQSGDDSRLQATQGLNFVGGEDADVLINRGRLSRVVFDGGADADVLRNQSGRIVVIDFEGDRGADLLINDGTVLWENGDDAALSLTQGIHFAGGDDADVLINRGRVTNIQFDGDAGADRFEHQSNIVDSLVFHGGDDADVLISRAFLRNIDFEGDAGADALYLAATTSTERGSVTFHGGTDADLCVSDQLLSELRFYGEQGNNVLQLLGGTIDYLYYDGQLGQSVYVNRDAVIRTLEFNGADNADTLINHGQASTIRMNTAGGDDTIVNTSVGLYDLPTLSIDTGDGSNAMRDDSQRFVRFEYIGGNDEDFLQSNTTVFGELTYIGGNGNNAFENNANSITPTETFIPDFQITVTGGLSNDVFANDGNAALFSVQTGEGDDTVINSGAGAAVEIESGSGNDRFYNYGEKLSSHFNGDDGDDLVVNRGAKTSLSFDAGGGANKWINLPSASATLASFNSDENSQNVFVNYADNIAQIYFRGGVSIDQFQNYGANISATFDGTDGNDQLLNAGISADINFIAGPGDDQFENRGPNAILTMDGDSGNDTLLQRARGVHFASLTGGEGDDWLLNFADAIGQLLLEGGPGNDTLQNGGDSVGRITLRSGAGRDTLENFGSVIGTLELVDGIATAGAHNRLLNSGSFITTLSVQASVATTLVSSGNSIDQIQFSGSNQADSVDIRGDSHRIMNIYGRDGADTVVIATNSPGASINTQGDSDNDLMAFSGFANSLVSSAQEGDDEFLYSGQTFFTLLDGGNGDDVYRFGTNAAGPIRIQEPSSLSFPSTNVLGDTLDFSRKSLPVTVDLSQFIQTIDASGTTLVLSNPFAIENVIGTAYGDKILGNTLKNQLAGADFLPYGQSETPLPYVRSQWVWLDFVSSQEPGNYHYTVDDQLRVKSGLERAYAGFNVHFVSSLTELPAEIASDAANYTTIVFNKTPESGRPGGESSEIDFGNIHLSGTATVQVNGLLGGREIVTSLGSQSVPTDGSDDIEAPDVAKPASTLENFIALSVKIAAHELGHLLGLRHYDAFGPVGYGVNTTPGTDRFKPAGLALEAAFESADHLLSSPASLGTTRFNDLRTLVFGAREATKLAIAFSDLGQIQTPEPTAAHATIDQSASLAFVPLSVPNLSDGGINNNRRFDVRASSIVGSIRLGSNGTSESDWYSFDGMAGATLAFETMSASLRRYFTSDSTRIDSVLRIFDPTGRLVSIQGKPAVSDDEFESSDSLLMDVTLPSTGTYYIEVDSFRLLPTDANYAAAVALRQQLESRQGNSDPTDNLNADELVTLQRLVEILDDRDTGQYELLVYSFQSSSANDEIDDLQGREGIDRFDGGTDDNYDLISEMVGADVVAEGSLWSGNYLFQDRGGFAWSATIDWGDGSEPESWHPSESARGQLQPLAHRYLDNGDYEVTLVIVNDDGLTSTSTRTIQVTNVAPTVVLSGPASSVPGREIRYELAASDPAGDADPLSISWSVRFNGQPIASQAGGTLLRINSAQAGIYDVTVTVDDEDSGVVTKNLRTLVFAFDVATTSTQRSWIESVDMFFGSPEQAATLKSNPSWLKLTRFDLSGNNLGTSLNIASSDLTSIGNGLSFGFGRSVIGAGRNSTAADGYYRLELDWNGDGSIDAVRHFYRLLGDVNGDHKVDSTDANLILLGLTKPYNRELDVNGDGFVNGTDRTWTQRSNGRRLADGLPLDD